MPGNRPERFAKAVASGADALILDLEDSVPLAEKAVARDAVAQWLATPPPVPAWIRVNPLTSLYHLDDLQAVSRARPAGIVLPKCEGMDDLLWLDKVLTEIERRNGWPNRSILVMAIATETARAMQRIHSFDHPMPRLAGILWGAEDLAASLGVRSLRDAAGNYLSPALRARDSALLASHACGIPAIDAVFTGLDNPEALAAETRAHAALGFTAKAAIHPAQIAVIHAALRPSDDDLAWAGEVVAELQDGAKASGRVRGGMVDQPHLNAARRLLAAVQRAAQRPS